MSSGNRPISWQAPGRMDWQASGPGSMLAGDGIENGPAIDDEHRGLVRIGRPTSKTPRPGGGDLLDWHATTILSVRRGGKVAMGGDGQVTLGTQVMKADAVKVRKLLDGQVLVGFAGSAADGFALLERFEGKLKDYPNNVPRRRDRAGQAVATPTGCSGGWRRCSSSPIRGTACL